MSTVIESLEKRALKQRPRFGAGDRVRVHFQVVEGSRRRTQVFEGIVIKRQGSGARETFTVRKQSFGVGRRADVPAALAEDREARGRRPRRRPPGEALLPARQGRQARPRRRAPLGDRGRAGRRGRGGRRGGRRRGRGGQRGGGRGRRAARGGGRAGRGGPARPAQAEEPARGGWWGAGGGGTRAGARGEGRRLPRRGRRLRVPRPHSTQGALLELVIIVALALGLALGIQAFIVKPYQIPSESMEPTLDVGQRVLVNRFLYHFKDPADRGHRRLPSARGRERRRRGGRVRRPDGPAPDGSSGAACDQPTPEEASVNFIKRIVAGPGDTLSIENGHPVVNGKIAEEDFIRPCTPGGACNLPQTDHHPARPLLHDGRQPWVERRQPLLGTRPPRLDHRQGLRHLLAARPDRVLLARARGGASGAPPRGLFRFDRSFGRRFVAGVDEAGRGSLAGPLLAAGVLIDLERIGRSERLALARLDDSKQKTPGGARGALSAA